MKAGVRRNIDRIARQFDELHSLSEVADRRVERISQWSVAEHLNHLMKADRSIFDSFSSPVEEPLSPITPLGRAILWAGWIPRGKGKSPSATRPDAQATDELAAEVETVRSIFGDVIEKQEILLEPRLVAKHPIFGGLNRAQWLRFVAVHHHHHAKIIRDVLRADPR